MIYFPETKNRYKEIFHSFKHDFFLNLDYVTFDPEIATLPSYAVSYEWIVCPFSYCTYRDSGDSEGRGNRDFVLPVTKAPLASFEI